MVEQLILPEFESVRDVAAEEYDAVVRMWHADPQVRTARFDTERFERMLEITDGRMHLHLHGLNRRIMFNVVRSLSQRELRVLAGGKDWDASGIGQLVLEMTRAIVEYGRRGTDERAAGQSIRLTDEDRVALADRVPEVVARIVLLAALRVQARFAYRWAGKGMRLRVDPSGRPVVGSFWEWEPDPEIRAAMAEYDARREATSWTTPTGLPVQRRDVGWEGGFPWFTAALCSAPVLVRYQRLNLTHTTNGFMVNMVDIAERLAHLADWDDEFTRMFGLSVAALRRVLRSLTMAMARNLGFDSLEFVDDEAGDTLRVISRLADPGDMAIEYLHEVLSEGSLRAPAELWVDTLTGRKSDGEEPPSVPEARAFLQAFTSNAGGPQQELRPRLFHDLERQTLLLDLTLTSDFADLCYLAVVQGRDGRGSEFERYARQVIIERLGLTPPFPFPPGLKLAKLGRRDDEIDFCFRWGDVLVNVDMKAKTRNVAIHRGAHKPVRNRVSNFAEELLERVEPRGRVLAELLRERGAPVKAVVSLLCTADVEYVPPGPDLRYAGVPRLLTAEEITDLIRDPKRWTRVVAAARQRSWPADHHLPEPRGHVRDRRDAQACAVDDLERCASLRMCSPASSLGVAGQLVGVGTDRETGVSQECGARVLAQSCVQRRGTPNLSR